MWNIKSEITLTSDDYREKQKEIQVQIAESLPEGFQNLGKWEQDVRKIGFQAMRKLFEQGIKLFEEKVISEYKHRSKRCHMVKRGKRILTLKTAFGEVSFPRQRMLCKRCGEWVLPINEALGLHDDEQERATTGFKELSCLCSVHHPYRQATEMIRHITQEPEIVSHEQVRQIVLTDSSGRRQAEAIGAEQWFAGIH